MTSAANMNRQHFVFEKSIRLNVTNETLTAHKLRVRVEGDEIIVSAEAYAKSVEILNENEDMVLEDNYFDMNAGEKRIRIISGEPVGLKVRSVYDI